MSCNAFSLYTNIFGIITGSISLVTLAFGFQLYLPSNRIRTLNSLLEDTEKILISAVEDGLLPDEEFREQAYNRLSGLQADSDVLRSRAYCATTWTRECKELFVGLSFKIGEACGCVKELRADIITSSQAQRYNIRCATSPASTTDHAISPTDRNGSLDDCTDSDVTSITISEHPEVDTAECDKCESEIEAVTEGCPKYQSDDTSNRDEATGRLQMHSNGVDQCRKTPADAVEAVTYIQDGEVDDTVPRVNLSVRHLDVCCRLPQTISPGAHDFGGHKQSHGHPAEQIPA